MSKVKAAIIGMGWIGTVHLEALRRIPQIEVDAIQRTSVVDAQKTAEKYGVPKYYSDYQDLINDQEIDVVHICTINKYHYQIARDCLKAGKHVICEKPLAMNSTQTGELVELAAQKNLINAVNFNVRYYPLVQQIKAIITSGKLGKIYGVHGAYLQDWLLYPTDYSWRVDSKLGGSPRAIGDIGTHWLDSIQFIIGQDVTEVMADFATFITKRKRPKSKVATFSNKQIKNIDYQVIPVDTEDYANVLLKFSEGVRGAVTISQLSAGRKNRLFFEINCSAGSVYWNAEMPNQLWVGYRDQPNCILLKDPALMEGNAINMAEFPGGHAEGFPDTFKQLYLDIYQDIFKRKGGKKTGKPSYPTFQDGHKEQLLCEAITESAGRGKWIKLV